MSDNGRDLAALCKPVPVRIAMGISAVVISFLSGRAIAQTRGDIAIGIVAGLYYLVLLSLPAASPRGVVRWSATHHLADAVLCVPMAFFALLLVRPLPLWWAALIALGLGAAVVPVATHRRRRRPRTG